MGNLMATVSNPQICEVLADLRLIRQVAALFPMARFATKNAQGEILGIGYMFVLSDGREIGDSVCGGYSGAILHLLGPERVAKRLEADFRDVTETLAA